MTFILDRLALGDRYDALDVESLKRAGIIAILNTAEEVDYTPDEDLCYLKIPLDDGVAIPFPYIHEAVEFIRRKIRDGKVLIHCNAGVSRSTAIAICYLYECGFGIEEALDFILSKRPFARPHPALFSSILAYYSA